MCNKLRKEITVFRIFVDKLLRKQYIFINETHNRHTHIIGCNCRLRSQRTD